MSETSDTKIILTFLAFLAFLWHHSCTTHLSVDQFLGFLDGQTRPAKFQIDHEAWVVRYMKDPLKYAGHNLRLASELVGYRIAQALRVTVPEFQMVTIDGSFAGKYWDHRNNVEVEIEVMSGPATACRFLRDARYPDAERDPLDIFWAEEYYLEIVARARTADTWIMNFDRRKKGNIALTGPHKHPQVWFLDFDQSFLSKVNPVTHGDRIHWCEEGFQGEWLDDPEVLSGFDGKGGAKLESLQRIEHFQDTIKKMMGINTEELEKTLNEIPSEWRISAGERKRWLECLLNRKGIAIGNILKKYGGKA